MKQLFNPLPAVLAAAPAFWPDLDLRLGHRLLEGGSDGGGSVYTFAMFTSPREESNSEALGAAVCRGLESEGASIVRKRFRTMNIAPCTACDYCRHVNLPGALAGKEIILALSYGDEDIFHSGGVNAIHSVQDLAAFYRMGKVHVIHARADKPGEVEARSEILQGAFDLGASIASGGPGTQPVP
jgi:hypothetical protein